MMIGVDWKQNVCRFAILGLLTGAVVACGDSADVNENNENGENGADDCEVYEQVEGPITTAVTLDGCYEVNSNLYVKDDGHLTIEPGSVILFAANVGLNVSGGKLTAQGTAQSGILFAGQESRAGFWLGIHFYNTISGENKLNYITVDGGGGDNTLSSAKPANLILSNHGEHSLKLSLENSTLKNSGAWGLSGEAQTTFVSFDNNTLTGNASGPAHLHIAVLDSINAASDYSGNDRDRLAIWGVKLSTDSTWKAINVPYMVTQTIRVADDNSSLNPNLTIEAGAQFEFNQNTGLTIEAGSTLTAIGDEDNRIEFRGTDSSPGFWRGVQFYNTIGSANKLIYVTIDGGGAEDNFGGTEPANLMLSNYGDHTVQLTLEDTILRNSHAAELAVGHMTTFTSCSGLNISDSDIVGDPTKVAEAIVTCGL